MAIACATSFESISLDAPFQDDRSSFVATLPSLRDAPTAAPSGPDSWDGIEPDAPTSLVLRMPDWCVDLGEEMVAMHAVELYTRLATGMVSADAKVWRIGREAWTPAREVPELRYAIDDAAGVTPPPARVVMTDQQLVEALSFAQAC